MTDRFPNLTAIAGGIGSGKSVVSRAVAAMGYDVYDCDFRARRLMDGEALAAEIAREFGSEIFDEAGILRRRELAAIVFADAGRLAALNALTHSAVRADLALWAAARSRHRHIFVETAILYQSGLDRMAARVWEVTAPEEIRIARVMERNGLTADEVRARIEAQDSFEPESSHPLTDIIVNDGIRPLLPQIEKLLANGTHLPACN